MDAGSHAIGAPKRVTVAIITYRRPEGLERLLRALDRQAQSPQLPFQLRVVVVDNDAEQGARGVVQGLYQSLRIPVSYFVEPRQGIPMARNAALANTPSDSDYVAFIDDDEWPMDDWLQQMLATFEKTGADCLWGPVRSSYPADAPALLMNSGLYDRDRFQAHLEDGAELMVAATDNVIVAFPRIKELGLVFDESLRFTGGTDLKFFGGARRAGMTIRWAQNAWVNEDIPLARLTWSWLIKRQYRIGNSYVASNIFGIPRFARAVYCAVGLVAILTGFWISLFSLKLTRRFVGFGRVLNGFGMIGGSFGLFLAEYAPKRMAEGMSSHQ